MRKIENQSKEVGLYKSNPTIMEAIEIYNRCKSAVELKQTTSKNRKRRRAQLVWITVADQLRKEEKMQSRNIV